MDHDPTGESEFTDLPDNVDDGVPPDLDGPGFDLPDHLADPYGQHESTPEPAAPSSALDSSSDLSEILDSSGDTADEPSLHPAGPHDLVDFSSDLPAHGNTDIVSASDMGVVLADEFGSETGYDTTDDPIFTPIDFDHSQLPIPVDGPPWTYVDLIGNDAAGITPEAGELAHIGVTPASAEELQADLAALDGSDPTEVEQSQDPAVQALQKLWSR